MNFEIYKITTIYVLLIVLLKLIYLELLFIFVLSFNYETIKK